MKRNRLTVRVAALISSISIVAVYVSCRSAEHKQPVSGADKGTDSKAFMGGSKSREVFAPEPAPAEPTSSSPGAQTKEPPRKTMGGSKSIMIVKPSDMPPPQPPATNPR